MDRVFQDAKDKYVTAVLVYGNADDHKLYKDAAFTNLVDEDVVKDAFLKGTLVVVVGEAFHRPASVEANMVDVSGNTYEAKANN